ncbi:MAG: acyltransferase, partial [Candidatus Obscuribacterales bacterium]|nr:acyltransferase [Candidatus Obscuribacterales bacterium]
LPEIDGLRFIAISTVVLLHVSVALAAYGNQSLSDEWQDPLFLLEKTFNFGVQLFFVLSGFILALPFAQADLLGGKVIKLKTYYLRRLLRIEPPYLIALSSIFLLRLLFEHASFKVYFPHFLASVFYLHNQIFDSHSWIMGQAWSLEVEAQFYITAPLLASIYKIKGLKTRRILLLILMLISAEHSPLLTYPGRDLHLLTFAHFFLCGLLLADFFLLDWQKPSKFPELWDLCGLAAATSLIAILFPPFRPSVLPAFLVLLIYAAAFRGKLIRKFVRSPWIVTIGGMCYTIYLYHQTIITGLSRATFHLVLSKIFWVNLVLQSVLLIPFILISSAILFLLFEKPFMYRDWLQTLSSIKLKAN